MLTSAIATYIFSLFIGVVIAFQLALAQIIVLLLFALVVSTRSGLVLCEYYELSKSAIWFVVGFSVLGAILNIITPSKKERMLWGPISIILLVCTVVVAWS